MKILLVSHQMDYSGAPIALLELAKSLKRLGHEVFYVALSRGPFEREFVDEGVKLFDSTYSTAKFDLAIANTVISVPHALRAPAFKVAAWIHESVEFFKVLRSSPRDFQLDQLELAAFPSKFQIDEFRGHMPETKLMQLRNCVDLGALVIPNDCPVSEYVCTGHWEPRKAQHQLIALIGHCSEKIRIKFVGASRPPSQTGGEHMFTGQIPPKQAREQIAAARGLISCATAETQNLAAIEALQAGVPVLLSDIPAHRELKSLVPQILLFDPHSPEAFVRGLKAMDESWLDSKARQNAAERARATFESREFDKNVASLLRHVNGGVVRRVTRRIKKIFLPRLV